MTLAPVLLLTWWLVSSVPLAVLATLAAQVVLPATVVAPFVAAVIISTREA